MAGTCWPGRSCARSGLRNVGFIKRLLILMLALVAVGVAISAGLMLFGGLLMIGGIMVLAYAGRAWLVEKGILNPRPGVPMDAPEEVTVIEGEFEQIENPMVQKDKK